MLHEFVTLYRDAIIARTREKVSMRVWPPSSPSEIDHGVPLFLSQLSETLEWEATATPFSSTAIGATAARHGHDLLARGFTVSQVVHDYGDICQAITDIATEQNAPITASEFHILNRCLDVAIAEAVTEHARITEASRLAEELERTGQVMHEVRNRLHTALFAFDVIKRGTVAINGSTGALLGRSLTSLRDLVDSTLSDIRMAASHHRPEHVPMATFLSDIGVAARLEAEYCGLEFVVDPIDAELSGYVDRQLLESALMNLLSNGFKFTRPGSRVTLRARQQDQKVRIEVEDQCGGIPESSGDPFKPFAERRGKDRKGLGLGLAAARNAVRAQGGDVHVVNLPDQGCIFVVEVPLTAGAVPTLPAASV